jgi:hypothetical protein
MAEGPVGYVVSLASVLEYIFEEDQLTMEAITIAIWRTVVERPGERDEVELREVGRARRRHRRASYAASQVHHSHLSALRSSILVKRATKQKKSTRTHLSRAST